MNYVIGAVRQEILGNRYIALRYSNGCRGLINVADVEYSKIDTTLVTIREQEKPNLEKRLVYYLNCDNEDIARSIYEFINVSRSRNEK